MNICNLVNEKASMKKAFKILACFFFKDDIGLGEFGTTHLEVNL